MPSNWKSIYLEILFPKIGHFKRSLWLTDQLHWCHSSCSPDWPASPRHNCRPGWNCNQCMRVKQCMGVSHGWAAGCHQHAPSTLWHQAETLPISCIMQLKRGRNKGPGRYLEEESDTINIGWNGKLNKVTLMAGLHLSVRNMCQEVNRNPGM